MAGLSVLKINVRFLYEVIRAASGLVRAEKGAFDERVINGLDFKMGGGSRRQPGCDFRRCSGLSGDAVVATAGYHVGPSGC